MAGTLGNFSGLSGIGNFSTGDLAGPGKLGAALAATGHGGGAYGAGEVGTGVGSDVGPGGQVLPGNIEAQLGFLMPMISGFAVQIGEIPGSAVANIPIQLRAQFTPEAPARTPAPQFTRPAPMVLPAPQPGETPQPIPTPFPQPFAELRPTPSQDVIERPREFRPSQDFTRTIFRPGQDTTQSLREFTGRQEFDRVIEQGRGHGDWERVRDDIAHGRIPTLTGADPSYLPELGAQNESAVPAEMPDLDALKGGAGSVEGRPIAGAAAPCLTCQMTDEERAQLIDALPAESVEVSFMCPSSEHAEKLAMGDPNHGCIAL